VENVRGRREKKILHRVLVRKYEGMRRLSIFKFIWEKNNEICLKELG